MYSCQYNFQLLLQKVQLKILDLIICHFMCCGQWKYWGKLCRAKSGT